MTAQTWFLTGCSSGLGRALAEAALEAGQRVIATARDVRQLADLERPGQCAVFALDVTEPAEVARVVAEAEALWDGLDVIVNNAGHGLLGAVEECDDAQVRRCFETHFFGLAARQNGVRWVGEAQKSVWILVLDAAQNR